MQKFSITLLFALCISNYCMANSSTPAKVLAGWVEKITLADVPFVVKAKLDTGAKTSSIYAEDIERFSKGKKQWVSFNLVMLDDKKKIQRFKLQKPLVRRAKIKSHDGEYDHRLVIALDLCFNGHKHTTEFNLVNRREYIYGILLGRSFLTDKVIIDPGEKFLAYAQCLK